MKSKVVLALVAAAALADGSARAQTASPPQIVGAKA